jgi:hypothetical protein
MIKKSIRKATQKIHDVFSSERGDLSAMVWVIGAAVVVVLVVVVFMTLAPQTAQTMWNNFTTYATSKFGI